MVQVDLPGAIAVGQFAALVGAPYLKNESDLFSHRLMGPITTYLSVMYAPVGMFLLVCWPAWEGMYWWDWIQFPVANPPVAFFYIGFLLAMVMLGILSFVVGHWLCREGKKKWVLAGAIISLVCTLAPFFIWPFTWYWVGTYADYHATPRTSTAMFDTPAFFNSWAIVMGYFVVSTTIFGIWLKKKVKKLVQAQS